MYERQTQARSFADAFGRKERLEHPIEDLRWDAGAGIADGQTKVGSRCELSAAECLLRVQVDPVEADSKRATAFVHRLHSISAEVHDDLMHPGGVAGDRKIAGLELDLQPDVRGQRP